MRVTLALNRLIHITIIILREYLCPCLGLGLFMSYVQDKFITSAVH